jgi:hypothetical protein
MKPQFDLIDFLRQVHRRNIRCLLIGRWAVAQHGAPVVTSDYDFWVDPADRVRLFRLLEVTFDAELPGEEEWSKPMVTAYVGPDKIDCFSARRIVNEEGQELVFDEVHARSAHKKDPAENLEFCVPSIDDLIALKKFSHQDPVKHARNLEDIRYLLTLAKKRDRKRP